MKDLFINGLLGLMLAFLLLPLGCKSIQEKDRALLRSFVGKNKTDIINKLGEPHEVIEHPKNDLVEWIYRRGMVQGTDEPLIEASVFINSQGTISSWKYRRNQ